MKPHYPTLVVMLTVVVALSGFVVVSLGQQTREPPLAPPLAPVPRVEIPPVVHQPADPRATLTETVGLLSGLYVYQTYLNIGLLADGKTERLYDEKAARAVLATVLKPLDTVDQQLGKVAQLAETPGNRQTVERLRFIVALLKRQGQELIAFWDNGQPAAGGRYEATRQEAWKQIDALLSLDRK